jgi:hypothetical protein
MEISILFNILIFYNIILKIGTSTKKNRNYSMRKNLGFLTLNTTRKMYTLAKFYGQESHAEFLAILWDWLALDDGSRFSRSHLEFPELKKLSEFGRVQALKAYSSQSLRYVFFAN